PGARVPPVAPDRATTSASAVATAGAPRRRGAATGACAKPSPRGYQGPPHPTMRAPSPLREGVVLGHRGFCAARRPLSSRRLGRPYAARPRRPTFVGGLRRSLARDRVDRKSTRLNSSHVKISYAV